MLDARDAHFVIVEALSDGEVFQTGEPIIDADEAPLYAIQAMFHAVQPMFHAVQPMFHALEAALIFGSERGQLSFHPRKA